MQEDIELTDGWYIGGGGIVDGYLLFHEHEGIAEARQRASSTIEVMNYLGVGVKLKNANSVVFCNKCGKKAPPYAEDVLLLIPHHVIPDHTSFSYDG